MDPRDLALLRVSARQGGCFSRADSLTAGFSRSAINRRLATGTWVHEGRGALRAAATLPSRPMREHAALLALGPHSFLSHGSATAHWGFTRQPRLIWCSVPHAKRVLRLPGVVVVRTHHVEYVVKQGLRIAGPERAFCDLGMIDSREQLAAKLASASQAGLVSLDRIEGIARTLAGRPGTSDLAAVIAEFRPEFESVLGLEFFDLIRRAGIVGVVPGLKISLPSGRYRVADGAIEALRLDLESDGFAYHGLPAQVQADKERDRELAMQGWRTARFTTVDIRQRTERTLAELPRIVAARAREIGIDYAP